MKEINIAMIGYAFMGKAHSNAYRQVSRFLSPGLKPRMKVICGRDEAALEEARERYGWEECATSWQKVVARDDIDLVDISSPGNTHGKIAVAAAKAGKHLFCEKPLANDLDEAKTMLAAVTKAKVKNMVAFNYRRVPAVALAKKLIDEGRLGRIFHFRAVYLQDWIIDPNFPLVWRLKKPLAGSGPHGDLNAHIVDLALHLVGAIDSVVGMDTTFIKERPLVETASAIGSRGATRKKAKLGKVTVDDATLFLARFASGALGSFEATRFAQGRKNYNRFEINGEKGSLVFNLERLNELELFDATLPRQAQGWSTILVTEEIHPYLSAWWPPGHTIGWEHTFTHQAFDLIEAISEDRLPSPSFEEGVMTQAVLEAVSLSCREKGWVKVSKLFKPRRGRPKRGQQKGGCR